MESLKTAGFHNFNQVEPETKKVFNYLIPARPDWNYGKKLYFSECFTIILYHFTTLVIFGKNTAQKPSQAYPHINGEKNVLQSNSIFIIIY